MDPTVLLKMWVHDKRVYIEREASRPKTMNRVCGVDSVARPRTNGPALRGCNTV